MLFVRSDKTEPGASIRFSSAPESLPGAPAGHPGALGNRRGAPAEDSQPPERLPEDAGFMGFVGPEGLHSRRRIPSSATEEWGYAVEC